MFSLPLGAAAPAPVVGGGRSALAQGWPAPPAWAWSPATGVGPPAGPEQGCSAALETVGLPTYGPEAWVIRISPAEHFGSLPFLTLGRVCVTSPFANYTLLSKKMGERDSRMCRNFK